MLNHKAISRKKSEHQFSTKQTIENDNIQLKRKKSTTIIIVNKLKKQQIDMNKNNQKNKQKIKLVNSHSKGKISKKNFKLQKNQKTQRIQKNDQNLNSLNHKKSIDKIKQSKTNIKEKQSKNKISTDRFFQTQKQEKNKNFYSQTGNGLVKTKSLSKINLNKNSQSKICFKKSQKRVSTIQFNNFKPQGKKSISIKLDTGKKPSTKNKLKKSESSSTNLKKPKLKAKKISQIIQKSILYSEVNFDFKQQISFLVGSGIKEKQNCFLPYHFQSQIDEIKNTGQYQKTLRQYKAATMIQKHFRGYIQRKYIEQAKYIIESIKKIQRFWRFCLKKKYNTQGKALIIELNRNEISNSLITIKDLNSTKKNLIMNQQIEIKTNTFQNELLSKNNLKEIIKNILDQNGLNETIKEKIRKAMKSQENVIKEQFHSQKQQIVKHCIIESSLLEPLSPIRTHKSNKSNKSRSEFLLEEVLQENNLSKDFYIRKKINMQIHSQKNFNSPMNSSNNSLVSPGMKKLISPKCLSNSFSKQMKANYNNYFKSAKNANNIYTSPRKLVEQNQRIFNSHSGQKYKPNNNHHNSQQRLFQQNIDNLNDNSKLIINKQEYAYSNQIKSNSDELQLSNSPIIQCTELYNNYEDDINLLQSHKFSEAQTQRFFKKCNQIVQNQDKDTIKPFPTAFYFIEQFCLLITDYLRAQEQTTQIFIQKFKGLKFFKIERIFKQWQRLEYQQYQDSNIQFEQLMMQQSYERPSILSRSQKKMIMQLPSLRLFLHENQYVDSQILRQKSPQNIYIKFMFDIFQQSIYKNFAGFNINNLHKGYLQQKKNDNNYINVILSEALGNISESAQMLCGSFQDNQELTQYEKAERELINQQRLLEMTNKFVYWDFTTCEIWIKMLVYKKIFDEVIAQVTVDLLVKL